MATDLFKDIIETRSCRSRYTVRIIPVQITCKCDMNEVVDVVRPLIVNFAKEKSPETFAIHIKMRSANVNRDDAIKRLAELTREIVGDCKVDIKKGEMTIMVELVAVCLFWHF